MYVLESARVAPTMGNSLSTRIVVLKSRESLRKLRIHVSTHDAPLVFLVCVDTIATYKDPIDRIDSAQADAAVAATHMVLAAADVDLGSIWVSKFNGEKVRTAFNLPKNLQVIHVLGMGLTTDKKSPNRHGLDRLLMSKMAMFLDD